jgi:hypothetical protein
MPLWRLQTEFAMDSVLPRDVLTLTPHFNDTGVGTDPQGLCDDLAAALDVWSGTGLRQITVTAYDAEGTPPVYPQGRTQLNTGLSPESNFPREVACCLSFFSERNIPRQRGRLYIPLVIISPAAQQIDGRPSQGLRTNIAELAPIFSDLGGVDVDWSIYSRVDALARPVTDWWIDDEWDTVRSRGLRATARTTGTTTEG